VHPAATSRPIVERATAAPSLAPSLLPAAVAGGLALLAVVVGWRGQDLPAHLLRIHLVERDGFEVWNNFWYSGHHTVGYGFAVPVLGAYFGIWTVAVASAVLSAFFVDRLILGALGRRNVWASLWFAVGTLTNVAVGRLPFALGMTIGLLALLAAQRHRWVLATAAAVATTAASPVASAFLAIVLVAWAIVTQHHRRVIAGLAAASLVPIVVIAVAFPQGGTYQFEWRAFLWILALAAAFWVLVPPAHQVVRMAAAAYAVVAIVAFVVPNPMGSNLERLGMYAAGPLLLAVVPVRRWILIALVPPLLWWQWSPAFDAMVHAGDDPATTEEYYAPLRQFLHSVGAETERVEIVATKRHWEAAYVAADLPLARGWERQLDRRYNELFYEPGLRAAEYHEWLVHAGVRWVALPDAELDWSAFDEAALLRREQWFLRPAFRSDHWHVWEVVDSPGLVDGPAELTHVDTETLRLRVLGQGDVTVRVHESAYWSSDPELCIASTTDGWIVLRDARPGIVEVFLDETDLLGDDDRC
jgi:hypothetical protein